MSAPVISAAVYNGAVVGAVIGLVSYMVGVSVVEAFRRWRARRNDRQVDAHRAMQRAMKAAAASGQLRKHYLPRDDYRARLASFNEDTQ